MYLKTALGREQLKGKNSHLLSIGSFGIEQLTDYA
jgi:hypothetical protein